MFGLPLKLRKFTFQKWKIYGAPMKPSKLFVLKDIDSNFSGAYIFFLVA